MAAKTEADKEMEQVFRSMTKTDPELAQVYRKWYKKAWDEDIEKEMLDYLDTYEWSITRFGHTFIAKPSGTITMIINSLEIILFITVYEDEAQFEISAELSKFTRVR